MNASPTVSPRYRWAFIWLTAASFLGLVLWPDFMAALGAGHAGVWFLDMNTLLASNDAVVMGLNPYLPNPLDYLRDAHAYSDWWLQLRHLGLGRDDRLWLGALVNILFFAAVFWRLRPGTFREMLVTWLLVWSPPVMLGFNRANPDLLIYGLLTPITWLLSGRGMTARGLAVAMVGLAIGLKYFPVVACLVVFLTARSRRELMGLLVTWVVLGLALALNLWDDVTRAGGLIAAATQFYTFGAAVLAANLGHGTVVFGVGFSLALPAFGLGWFYPLFRTQPEGNADFADFFLGATLMAACFFLTISYTYRFVFALMMVPWLLKLTGSGLKSERRFAWVLLLFSLGLFWSDGLAVIMINGLSGIVPDAVRTMLGETLVVGIHAGGWLWVILLLAGLGSATRFIYERWCFLPAGAEATGGKITGTAE